uniref:Uncharacterized protein n=1 Tax=Schizaphis graminum TaxID=13262 RepID=A0A2S2NM00_SCHGA
MALLGALAATGSRRQGCVLRAAADAITFYCGGDVVSGGSGSSSNSGGGGGGSGSGDGAAAEYGQAVAASGRSSAAAGDRGFGDYFRRPVRSVADDGSGAGGYYYGTENGSSAAVVLANATTGLEPFLNGSYNHTLGADVEDLTNYIFVITIGIILGAMILTTICETQQCKMTLLYNLLLSKDVCMGEISTNHIRLKYISIIKNLRLMGLLDYLLS